MKNVIPTEEFRATNKLVELVTWLENNRNQFTAILARGEGFPGRATVMQEMRTMQYELYQWLLHLPK